jgi:hypothetical protein
MAVSPQPFYTVQVDVEGCAYDIRVNDAPLLENPDGLPVVVEIPINHLVRTGTNEISMRMRPIDGRQALDSDTKRALIVYLRESGETRERRSEVGKLEHPGPAPVRRDGRDMLIATTFSATVPFPPFRWFASPEIANDETTRTELIRELEKFHSLLAAKNIDAILATIRERDREHAEAYYESMREQLTDSSQGFQRLFDDTEYTLRPARLRNPRLRVFGNNRLARLDLSNGQSPLYYLMSDDETAVYVTLVFCRDAQGRWLVIR